MTEPRKITRLEVVATLGADLIADLRLLAGRLEHDLHPALDDWLSGTWAE